jgi:hypothetical protein
VEARMSIVVFSMFGMLISLLFILIVAGCSYAAWLQGKNQQFWLENRVRILEEIMRARP